MRRFLVIKLSAIGDVIHALPVAKAIKSTYPDSHLTWVVEPIAYEILKLSPYIDKIIIFPKKEFKTLGGWLRNFFPFRREIQIRRYDAVLDLQGLGKSAAIAFLAESSTKLGTANMRELSNLISKPIRGLHSEGHIVDRYLDVAAALGIDTDEAELELTVPEQTLQNVVHIFRQSGGNIYTPYVALAIGANWPNKRWRTDSFASLADKIYDLGYVPILIGSGAVDENLAAEILMKTEIPPINLVGRTTLPELAAIVMNATVVIGGDTGTVHLAAELKIPSIMLMGPTDANRNGPYRQPENAIEISRSCKHCWKRSCPKGLDCLADITVDDVYRKLTPILN